MYVKGLNWIDNHRSERRDEVFFIVVGLCYGSYYLAPSRLSSLSSSSRFHTMFLFSRILLNDSVIQYAPLRNPLRNVAVAFRAHGLETSQRSRVVAARPQPLTYQLFALTRSESPRSSSRGASGVVFFKSIKQMPCRTTHFPQHGIVPSYLPFMCVVYRCWRDAEPERRKDATQPYSSTIDRADGYLSREA